MSSMTDTASAEMTMSALISWRNGWRRAAAMSMPLARASISARSRMVTMSWSRSDGFSSRRPIRAITHTTRPTTPQIRYSWVQKSGFVTTAGMVALPTTATIRLPSTGPLVQKPMAVARPTCGEKSRIRAGVATRQMPSMVPMMKPSMLKAHLFGAAGRMNKVKMAVSSRPATTRLARPSRSVRPASSEPNAPIRFPKASTTT